MMIVLSEVRFDFVLKNGTTRLFLTTLLHVIVRTVPFLRLRNESKQQQGFFFIIHNGQIRLALQQTFVITSPCFGLECVQQKSKLLCIESVVSY